MREQSATITSNWVTLALQGTCMQRTAKDFEVLNPMECAGFTSHAATCVCVYDNGPFPTVYIITPMQQLQVEFSKCSCFTRSLATN